MQIVDPKLKAKIPAPLRSKFVLLFLAYFIYLLFFNQNTISSQIKLAMQLHELNKEEDYYTKEIVKVKQDRAQLFSGIDQMEKYARENYWMKKDSEDLYVFMPEEK